EVDLLIVGRRPIVGRQAAIVYAELQAVRALLKRYVIQNVELPLLVVRPCPGYQGGAGRGYPKRELRIAGCKGTREWQSPQRNRSPEAVQARRKRSVRAAVVKTEIVRKRRRNCPQCTYGCSLGVGRRRGDHA